MCVLIQDESSYTIPLIMFRVLGVAHGNRNANEPTQPWNVPHKPSTQNRGACLYNLCGATNKKADAFNTGGTM